MIEWKTYQRLLLRGIPTASQIAKPARPVISPQMAHRVMRPLVDEKVRSVDPAWIPRKAWKTVVRQPEKNMKHFLMIFLLITVP